MGSSRNRNAGHKYERDKAQIWRGLGYEDVRCSREVSRLRDNKKVDLCNADEDENGRLPFNLQCKTLAKAAPYPKLLKELEEHNKRKQINVVLHKMTEKSQGGRFLPAGEFAILNSDDFEFMVERLLAYEKFLVKQGIKLTNPVNKQLNENSTN